ncbi:tRNA 2-thiouridine(34) synthase MnmA [Rickettsiales endosymbiont of Peranema trichophorum]|uniref:tRNA 2-thiouridine(34) synthase MnmA n=1 Tax=Rickettsiales endosymbiont of Peranema trichophorum TaxID=2486577 RepID=UPI00397E8985
MRIVVAMSGGVDSSTVAAMLANEGYEVIGITMQLYNNAGDLGIERKGTCCAGQDIYDAQVAASKIGIKHYVLNYESVFKKEVIDDFADSYLRGETPIPCVKCNQTVKFRDLLKVAKDLGANALATGHYVSKRINDGISELHKAKDALKDQSYFLFHTTKEQLDFLMFPLGGMHKSETREMAKKYGLPIAEKPDSQDICFVGGQSYADVIGKLRPGALDPGEIVYKDGTVLGVHNGIINFTVGQRKGIGVSHSTPLYVLAIDQKTNRVTVGEKSDLNATVLHVGNLNWLGLGDKPYEPFECQVKLRYSQDTVDAKVIPLQNDVYKVELDEPYTAISPGQACVMYDNTRVLGGGWILRRDQEAFGSP